MITAGSISATAMCFIATGGCQTSIQPVARYRANPQTISARPSADTSE
jgi:hypothetical protein